MVLVGRRVDSYSTDRRFYEQGDSANLCVCREAVREAGEYVGPV